MWPLPQKNMAKRCASDEERRELVELLVKVEPAVLVGEVVVHEISLVDSYHPPAHAGAEEVDRIRAEPATQYPVEGRRHSAPYDVAKDRGPGLEPGVGLDGPCQLPDVAERFPAFIARSIEARMSSSENSCSGTITASQPQAIEA